MKFAHVAEILLQINYYFSSTIGILINVLILYILCRLKDSKLQNFRVFLMGKCFSDAVYSCSTMFAQTAYVIKGEVILSVTLGPLKQFDKISNELIIGVWAALTSLSGILLLGTYVYQYLTLCRKMNSTTLKVVLIHFLVILMWMPLLLAMDIIFVDDDEYEEHVKLASETLELPAPLYFMGGKVMTVAPVLAIYLLQYSTSYSVIVYCTISINKFLASHAAILSGKVLKVHRDVIWVLTVQASIPLCLVAIPVAVVIGSGVFLNNIGLAGLPLGGLYAWLPACQGVATLKYAAPIRSYFTRMAIGGNSGFLTLSDIKGTTIQLSFLKKRQSATDIFKGALESGSLC